MNLLEEIQEDRRKANDPKEQDKKKRKENKAKREREKIAKRKRAERIGIAVSIILIGLVASTYWFAKNYYVQVPFTPRPLIVKIEPETLVALSPVAEKQEEVKELTDIEIIEQYKFAPILKSIYMLESTKGEHDGCKDSGKINGYGYAQTESGIWRCYDTFEQVTDRVNEWLENRLSTNGNDLGEALCYYNTGHANQVTCDYSQKFMRVLTDNL